MNQSTVQDRINWSLIPYSKTIHQKNFKFLICIDNKTYRIKTWLVTVNSFTTQNIIRKLTNLLIDKNKENSNPTIFIFSENEPYTTSKAYKKFLETHSEICQAKFFEELPTSLQKTIKNKIESFFDSMLTDPKFQKNLKETVTEKSTGKDLIPLVDRYINNWNSNEMKYFFDEESEEGRKIIQVKQQFNELIQNTPNKFVTYDESVEITQISMKINELAALIAGSNFMLTGFVEQTTKELSQQIESVDQKIHDVSFDVKQLIPKEKRKHNPLPLRDAITFEIFQILLFNAGSIYSYQKEIRKCQLKITYTLLYHLGVRLNELRPLTLQEIQDGLERSEIRVTLFKTNKSHNYTLSISAKEDLQKLKPELEFLQKDCNFKYLFGKTSYPHKKTLLRIVNQDLRNTCQLCNIPYNISSHSFRISLISRLMRITTIQNVAAIIGHEDVRSTMKYSRYRLSKSVIQDLHKRAEDALSKDSW